MHDTDTLLHRLTIFTCPKPFSDFHIRLIQRNAIGSWTLMVPRPRIILMGGEAGSEEVAVEFGAEVVGVGATYIFETGPV